MKKFFFLIFFYFLLQSQVFSDETFLSLKKDKVNVRYGPSFKSPIKFVYKKLIYQLNKLIKKRTGEE